MGLKLIKAQIPTQAVFDYLVSPSHGYFQNLINLDQPPAFWNYVLGIKTPTIAKLEISKNKMNEGDYLEDPKPKPIQVPVVYIYNTHQTEQYQKDYLEPYSIKPTVMLASYILREKLNDLGIEALVETNEVKKILNQNNWKYGRSYDVSRQFLETAKAKYPSLKLYLDLHRDSSVYQKTTLNNDGVSYVRILFVVGLEHPNWEKNYQNTVFFNDLLKTRNQSISRGIYKKKGPGVNGKYNQDFDEHLFLIELGGQYNKIEEVNNTLDLVADVVYEYLIKKLGIS